MRVILDPEWVERVGVEPMLERVCEAIATDARNGVHVDDGDTTHLSTDIAAEVHGTHGRVGSNLPYALTEEYRQGGSVHAGSHAFLRPALYKPRRLR